MKFVFLKEIFDCQNVFPGIPGLHQRFQSLQFLAKRADISHQVSVILQADEGSFALFQQRQEGVPTIDDFAFTLSHGIRIVVAFSLEFGAELRQSFEAFGFGTGLGADIS